MTTTNSPGHWSTWPPVRNQADLERHWRMLMGPLGFGQTLLWVIFFDPDGYLTPVIQQIDDMPDVPTPVDVARAWGTAVTLAARDARVKVHPFHLANDDDLRVFTVDDLAA